MLKSLGRGLIAVVPLTVLVMSGCSKADESAPAVQPATQPAPAAQTSGYPLEICVVSGEKLGSMGDPVIFMHEGREVRFCCSNCEAEFKKDASRYIGMLDDAKSGARAATQPLGHAH